MLAFYDLFAVLTPCGPLKALAELISKEGAQGLPGMLYEARLPNGISRNSRRRQSSSGPNGANGPSEEHECNDDNDTSYDVPNDAGEQNSMSQATGHPPLSQATTIARVAALRQKSNEQQSRTPRQSSQSELEINITEQDSDVSASVTAGTISSGNRQQQQVEQFGQQDLQQQNDGDDVLNTRGMVQPTQLDSVDMSHIGKAALALAKMYHLPVLDKKGVLRPTEDQLNRANIERNSNVGYNAIGQQPYFYTAVEVCEIPWTPRQLTTDVTCVFPPRGGSIRRAKSREQKYGDNIAYIVYDRSGDQQRKFVVTPIGSIMEVRKREGDGNRGSGNDTSKDDDNTIKLGIGDFIFYSVLVSKAAQYSFAAFASCLLVVLSGLAATLVALAIKGKALPALPISIFLGVITFLWTKTFLQPWISNLLIQSTYV